MTANWVRVAALGLATLAAAAAPAVSSARAQEEATSGIFHGVGTVLAVQPKTGALTVNHEEIKGFMAAMEMMYRVASPDLVKGLKPGDRIEFDIDAAKYTITSLRRLPPAQ